jgi:hypothetical protein
MIKTARFQANFPKRTSIGAWATSTPKVDQKLLQIFEPPLELSLLFFILPAMVESDDDYVEGSDDDTNIRSSGRVGVTGTRSKSSRTNKEVTGFEVTRTWENLTEGADGTITGAVEGLLQAGKRQR